jgi:hypothetical protein
VVYVPQYNPEVVYTTPPPATAPTPTPTATEDTVSTGTAVAAGLLAFGVGVLVGNAFSHDDYCYPNWGHSAVYIGPRPFYPPAYAYRPVYGPTFHPAYRYAPPAGYRYSYNNRNNVVINNNNYYNRFNNNQNLRAGTVQSPIGTPRQVTAQNRSENWRGQTSYAGARNTTNAERNVPGTERNVAGAERNVAKTQRNAANAERGTANAQRNVANAERTNRNTEQRKVSDKTNASGMQARDRTAERDTSVDRGYGDSNRGALASRSADTSERAPSRENALAGADREGGGAFERAASARGQASSGGRREHVAAAGQRRGGG